MGKGGHVLSPLLVAVNGVFTSGALYLRGYHGNTDISFFATRFLKLANPEQKLRSQAQ